MPTKRSGSASKAHDAEIEHEYVDAEELLAFLADYSASTTNLSPVGTVFAPAFGHHAGDGGAGLARNDIHDGSGRGAKVGVDEHGSADHLLPSVATHDRRKTPRGKQKYYGHGWPTCCIVQAVTIHNANHDPTISGNTLGWTQAAFSGNRVVPSVAVRVAKYCIVLSLGSNSINVVGQANLLIALQLT